MSEVGEANEIVTTAEENLLLAQPEAEDVVEQVRRMRGIRAG